ncbi:MAG: hypothetical protein Q9168_005904, partial [Polycauliona sp. 1 TL-2023]
MVFANLFAANRKNKDWKKKSNTAKQGLSIRELGISAPIPLEPGSNDPYTINLLKQGGLRRAPHIRRPNEPPVLNAHLVQSHRRADLDCNGDLGLQGGAHRMAELYPKNEVGQADSGYGTDKRLVVRNAIPSVDGDASSIVNTPASMKAKEEPFKERRAPRFANRFDLVDSDYEYQEGTGIFGWAQPRGQNVRLRDPRRQPSPVPSEVSMKSLATESSQSTLCGSIKSNGKYDIEESAFKQKTWLVRAIGEGSFGRVELRKNKRTAELLVLKTIRTIHEYIDNTPAEVYIIRDILGNVHENLPKVLHYNKSLAQLEIWMDYCDGGDLVTLMEFHVDRQKMVPE